MMANIYKLWLVFSFMVKNRRDFLKWLAKSALLGGLTYSLLPIKGSVSVDRSVNWKDSDSLDSNLDDLIISKHDETKDKTKNFRLGVMTDLHGHTENSQYFADQLLKENVDAYFLGGDLSNLVNKGKNLSSNTNNIFDVVEPVAQTGKLVLVVPGNHETHAEYDNALKSLSFKYSNVIDMQKKPVVDLNGLTILGLGGNDDYRFTVSKGYLLEEKDFYEIKQLGEKYQNEKPLLIASHVPRKYHTLNGLDVIANGKVNVGSANLKGLRELLDLRFSVSGHIHEAYGIIGQDEQVLRQGEFSDRLDFNPGAVHDYTGKNLKSSAGIVEFKGNIARAYIINR
jgi:Icc-related predicted phosphoesterase